MTEIITVEDKTFEAIGIPTENTSILLIRGSSGFLGCGYFNLSVADRTGDCAAVVNGVKNFEDMLDAQVAGVSRKAGEKGIAVGMSGREALLKMAR